VELVVAMALTIILGLIALTGQRFMVNVIARTSERTTTRANMSLVLDQLTKELREATTVIDLIGTNDGGRQTYGVTLPTTSSTRSLVDVLAGGSPTPPLSAGQSYVFPSSPTTGVLEFFTVDDAGVKHRIRYSLALPMTSGGAYAGLSASNWVRPDWQPCCVTYRNNRWVGGAWTTETPRIVTDQVVRDFSATKVAWSNNVIQIAISAYARNLSGGGSSLMTLVSLVTLRR
jgi:type II secretory pathway pseudopilin PulG